MTKKLLIAALTLFATMALADDDQSFVKSVLCHDLVIQHGDNVDGSSDESKEMQCRQQMIIKLDNDEQLQFAMWSTKSAFFFCNIETNNSKTGIGLGNCDVSEPKPRIGVSNE